MLFIERDLVVVPVRSIILPVLESYVLPVLSIILVLGVVVVLLPEIALRVFEVEVLPVKALLVPLIEVLPFVDLPDNAALVAVLFAELVRYVPELLPERLLVKLL